MKTPLYTALVTFILLAAGVCLVIFAPPENESAALIIGVIASSLPSIVASLYAERAARDIRNGVMVEKVKQGTTQALEETQVVTRSGPVVAAQLGALTRLLETNTAVTRENTAVVKEATNGG